MVNNATFVSNRLLVERLLVYRRSSIIFTVYIQLSLWLFVSSQT